MKRLVTVVLAALLLTPAALAQAAPPAPVAAPPQQLDLSPLRARVDPGDTTVLTNTPEGTTTLSTWNFGTGEYLFGTNTQGYGPFGSAYALPNDGADYEVIGVALYVSRVPAPGESFEVSVYAGTLAGGPTGGALYTEVFPSEAVAPLDGTSVSQTQLDFALPVPVDGPVFFVTYDVSGVASEFAAGATGDLNVPTPETVIRWDGRWWRVEDLFEVAEGDPLQVFVLADAVVREQGGEGDGGLSTDAGNSVSASGQPIVQSGFDGVIGNGPEADPRHDVDCYVFDVVDPSTFSAETSAGPASPILVDTQIFLFDSARNFVEGNDDSGSSLYSRIGPEAVDVGGRYELCVTSWNNDPVLTAGALSGWSASGNSTGSYRLELTGVAPPGEGPTAPVATGSVGDQSLQVGAAAFTISVAGLFEDPNGDALTYSAASSAPGVATAAVSGSTLTVTPIAEGTATVSVTAQDPGGLTGALSFSVAVAPAAAAPVATGSVGDQSLQVGAAAFTISVAGLFEDPNGDALTYSAASSAPGVATAAVSGSTLTVTPIAEGTATVSVTAQDPGGLTGALSFSVAVAPAAAAPVATGSVGDQSLQVGAAAFTISVAGLFEDPNGDALTYSAASSAPGVATAAVSGSTLTVTPIAEGTATVSVTAQDPGGLTGALSFSVAVAPAAAAPVATGSVGDQSLQVGAAAFTISVAGLFEDPNGDALTYSAASSAPGVATAAVSGSTLTVTPIAEGTATVSVTAQDPGGLTGALSFSVEVDPAAPPAISTVSVSDTAPSVGQEVTVTVRLEGQADDVQIQADTGVDSQQLTVASNGSNQYTATIPASMVTSKGLGYYVSAENSGGSTSTYGSVSVRVPSGVGSPSFGAGSTATGYRLVSVPLVLENRNATSVLDEFGPYNDGNWRILELLAPGQEGTAAAAGADGQSYREGASVRIQPGRGFWLLTREGGAFNTGTGRTVPIDSPYRVNLHSGWNLVGNPFDYNTPVNDIETESGVTPQLWTYDGGWSRVSSSSSLQPFRGYAIRSSQTDALYLWPYSSSGGRVASSERPISGVPASDETERNAGAAPLWEVRVEAHAGGSEDSDNAAVAATGVSTSLDASDWPEPPPIGDYVALAFEADGGTDGSQPVPLAVDARPVTDEGAVWPLVVRTSAAGPVELRFGAPDTVPAEYGVWLVDDVAGTAIDLRQEPRYTFASPGDGRPVRFRLVVGTPVLAGAEGALREASSTLSLGPNYPNPFQGVTTVRYRLPEPGRVVLEAFDLLGRHVATLVDREAEAGTHAIVWDARGPGGSPLAGGSYVLRLSTGSDVVARRVVLIR